MEVTTDTSFLISCSIKEDINHEKALKMFKNIKKIYIPTIVIHELVWFAKSKNLSKDFILQWIFHEKSELEEISYDDILFSLKNVKNFKMYNDFLVISVSLRLGKELITFDLNQIEYYKQFKGLK